MTVAYAYFRYLLDRENHNSVLYYFAEPTDVQLIGDDSLGREDWTDMGKADKSDKPDKAAQDVETAKKNDEPSEAGVDIEETTPKRFILAVKKMKSSAGCETCTKIIYVILLLLAFLVCLSVIVISMMSCVATKVYDTEQSNRLVGMVILAVTSAATSSMCIYSAVAVFKNQSKPIHATSVVLFVLVIIQALIIGVSVKVNEKDELNLGQSLAESFKLAKDDNPRHVKLWTATQSDLNCCGVYGPEDYRRQNLPTYFPPNVPIACCPTYNRDRSPLVQEREREMCKAKKTFYNIGCKHLVVNIFKETADVMVSITLALVAIEILISIIGGCCLNKKKPDSKIEVVVEE